MGVGVSLQSNELIFSPPSEVNSMGRHEKLETHREDIVPAESIIGSFLPVWRKKVKRNFSDPLWSTAHSNMQFFDDSSHTADYIPYDVPFYRWTLSQDEISLEVR